MEIVCSTTKGERLKADASANLVAATDPSDIVIAQAMETISATEYGEVLILAPVEYGPYAGYATEVVDPTTPAPTALSRIYTMTPTASKTVNWATVPSSGKIIVLKVLTSGTSTYTLTFGANVTST